GGAQYPAEFPWTKNIFFVQHLPPAEHPSFFCSSRLTLNITRTAMREMGWCPSGRLFEAAACGVPILSDWWDGLDEFFASDSEILVGAVERPRAISEYLVDRMITGGASKLCFVIAPGKSDILEYYGGGNLDSVTVTFVVQPHPSGLCDAIFQAAPLVAPNETVCVGLPDTIWFPENALCALGD